MNEVDLEVVQFGYQWDETRNGYSIYEISGEFRKELAFISGYHNEALAKTTLSFYIGQSVAPVEQGHIDGPPSGKARLKA